MKKILSIFMALSILTALSACADDETDNKTSSDEATQSSEQIADDAQVQGTSEDSGSENIPGELTFAQYLLEDFKTIVSDNPDMTSEQIAQKLSENEMILFSSMFMPVEEGFLSGFTQEITGFESGAMFGPAMGSIAFIGYVFELADEDTAKSFTETLTGNADPRWQICVEAEETVCEAVGNKVFFVMAPLSNQ